MPTVRCRVTPYRLGKHLIVLLPPWYSARLPSRGQVMVRGAVNGVEFTMPLEPDGRGSHWLSPGSRLQKAAGITAGKPLELTLEATRDWPEPPLPADWRATLRTHADIRGRWQDVTPLARWEWLRWIGATNNTDTRKHRIAVACSKLRRGERRPCCFNRNMCCVPAVSRGGLLLGPAD